LRSAFKRLKERAYVLEGKDEQAEGAARWALRKIKE